MSVTLVVPFYNEAARWNEEYWTQMFGLADIKWLLVNDGSSDFTSQLIDSACAKNNHVSALHLARNVGKAEAVRQGMVSVLQSNVLKSGIGFIDGDGAFSPIDVDRLCTEFIFRNAHNELKLSLWTARIALAGRNVKRSEIRHYLGRIIATFLSAGLNGCPYDTQSGFKIFPISSQLEEVLFTPFRTRWLFDVEILIRWEKLTLDRLPIREEPLDSWKDVAGSKLTYQEIFRIIRELIIISRLKRQLGNSR
jgi:glycosyltransferase involved in cell wall biosynthesis